MIKWGIKWFLKNAPKYNLWGRLKVGEYKTIVAPIIKISEPVLTIKPFIAYGIESPCLDCGNWECECV